MHICLSFLLGLGAFRFGRTFIDDKNGVGLERLLGKWRNGKRSLLFISEMLFLLQISLDLIVEIDPVLHIIPCSA